MSGAWTMTDDGDFILDPAYEEQLTAIKRKLREQWIDTLCAELARVTTYSQEQILDEFLTRMENDRTQVAAEVVDSLILEALEGNL